MFNLEGIQSSPPDTQALRTYGKSVLETLKYLHTFPAEREKLFFSWWALSHGFVSLAMSGQLPDQQENLKTHYLAAIQDFIKGMA